MDSFTEFAMTTDGQVTIAVIMVIVLVLYVLLLIWETKNVN